MPGRVTSDNKVRPQPTTAWLRAAPLSPPGLPMLLIVLTTVAGVLALVLVVWHRTPWGRRRPMPRYAVLSLVAHIMLAIVAAAVRVVAWPPGAGEPEPIRVTVLTDLPPAVVELITEEIPESNADVETAVEPVVEPQPSASDSESAEIEADPPAEPPAEIAEPLSAPELSPSVEVVPEPVDAIEADAVDPVSESNDVSHTEPAVDFAPSDSSNQVANDTQTSPNQPTPAPQPPLPIDEPLPQNQPQAAAPFAERLSPDRLARAIEHGGSRETEEAVENALAWLASAQAGDGRWHSAQWGGGRETQPVLNHNRGRTGAQADTGITGLALLAFLGAGNTHQAGPYQPAIADALNFLIRNQRSDGYLGGDALPYARTYCHSMATFALAESLAMTGDQRLRPSVERAVDYLVSSQDVGSGGWRYRPGQPGDLSQLGWVIMALRSAELAGVAVPDTVWQRTEHFLSLVGRGKHGGLGCYMPGSGWSRAMTAEALYCRQILGLTAGDVDQSRTHEAVDYLAQELPGDTTVNLYHWYYASLALHHAAQQSPATKPTWQRWNERLQIALLPRQEQSGAARGSWPANTVWGGYGGRVYSTAMATMCLEVYYRYNITDSDQDPWVAARPGPTYR